MKLVFYNIYIKTFMSTFIVYKIICISYGKLYIGYTKQNIEQRLREHFKKAFNYKKSKKNKFSNAIRKHGKINFKIEIIKFFTIKEEALLFEIETIKNLNTTKDGYNTAFGGEGGGGIHGPLSEEHKKKISESNKGKIKTKEHCDNIKKNHHNVNGKNNPFFGKKHSKETKEKIGKRKYIKGEKHHNYGKPTKNSFKSGDLHPLSKPVTINEIRYASLALASKSVNKSIPFIRKHYLNVVI
jgi:group I intron endonuclease